MKDGEFDRLRIPLDDGSDAPGPDDAKRVDAQRTGVAASPAQLAAGSAILAGLILAGRRGPPPATRIRPGEAGGSG